MTERQGGARYAIKGGDAGRARLEMMARFKAPVTRALRPGGVFVSEDDDLRTCFCVPQRDAFERAARLQHDAIERRNGWRSTYLRLPALLREAGLADVGLSLSQSVWTDAATKSILPISLALMADAIIGEGLATRDEIDALLSELDALAEDPASLCAAPRTHQAWGRKR